MLSAAEAGPFQQLTRACEVFLDGLHRAPDDEFLERGFRTGADRFKTFQPVRWSKWPWNDREEAEEMEADADQPPGPQEPTELVTATTSSIEVQWPEYEPLPSVPGDAADSYYLEMAHLCPLDGQTEWRRAYKGSRRSYTVRGLSLTRDLLLRVCAVNRKGNGEWSAVRRYRVASPPPPRLVEHKDIPPSWRAVDIEDVLQVEKLADGSADQTMAIQALFNSLHFHRTTIKVAFRYYALVGASSSKDDDADSMSMQQFANFVRSSRLLDDSGMISSDFDRIFMRSVRELPSGGSAAPSSVMTALLASAASATDADGGGGADVGEKEWMKTRGAVKVMGAIKTKGKDMFQQHFVGALVRIANTVFASELPNMVERFDHLCKRVLAPHVGAELDLLHDAFSKLMTKQPMVAVSTRRKAECERIFGVYSAVDKSLDGVRALATMNILELTNLCEDASLFDHKFGVRDIVNCFVRVNIEDDIYIQADKQNTSTELVYDEFFEVLARMYHTREGGAKNKKPPVQKMLDSGEDGLELARGFDEWLATSFLPRATAAITLRKKANKL